MSVFPTYSWAHPQEPVPERRQYKGYTSSFPVNDPNAAPYQRNAWISTAYEGSYLDSRSQFATAIYDRARALSVIVDRLKSLVVAILRLHIIAQALPDISEDAVTRSERGEGGVPMRCPKGVRRSNGAQVYHETVDPYEGLQLQL